VSEPVPVAIVAPDPIPVVLAQEPRPTGREHIQRQSSDPSVPARTTFQQDLTTAGQRVINLKWESTQQIIAVAVSLFTLSVCAWVVVAGNSELSQSAFIFLTNIAFLVVGTYFQRTNHTKTGGVAENSAGR
jgi:hypothetical protein